MCVCLHSVCVLAVCVRVRVCACVSQFIIYLGNIFKLSTLFTTFSLSTLSYFNFMKQLNCSVLNKRELYFLATTTWPCNQL